LTYVIKQNLLSLVCAFAFVNRAYASNLPDNLGAGICHVKIKYSDWESNQGTMGIKQ
jgi:hypothetical protein